MLLLAAHARPPWPLLQHQHQQQERELASSNGYGIMEQQPLWWTLQPHTCCLPRIALPAGT